VYPAHYGFLTIMRYTNPRIHSLNGPKAVTHPRTNRARRALTSFMRRTPLTTTPRPCTPRDQWTRRVTGSTCCQLNVTVMHARNEQWRATEKYVSYTYEWLGSRVVSVLDSGGVGPGFKSLSRRCGVTVLGKLFTPIVPLFTKQQNWYQPS